MAVSAETKKLEEETRFMESELMKLRDVVHKQRIKEESQRRKRAKSTTKSPRYRKLRAKDKPRDALIPSKLLRPELAHKWTAKHVSLWLETIHLPQYKATFRRNHIDGPVLLELSVDDLDYMEVKALAHRKVLLKGVQKLRNTLQRLKEGRSKGIRQPPIPETEMSVQSARHEVSDDAGVAAISSESKEEVHAEYNEEAAHRSFVEAVEEWRNMQKKPDRKSSSTASEGQSGVIDEKEHSRFRAAVHAWRDTGGSDKGKAEIVSYEQYIQDRSSALQKMKAQIVADFETKLAIKSSPTSTPCKYSRSDIDACY